MTTEHPDEEHHSTNNNHPTVDKKKQQHHRSRSSKKERSSRRQRNSSGSHDNNNDDEQHRSSSRPSSARDGHHTKKKKKTERRHKNKTSNSSSSSKQKSSSSRGTMQNPSPPPPKKTEGGGGGVTVSQFLVKQQTIQNEVSTYKNNSMVRQRMMYEQQFDDDDDDEGEASIQHYFDENDSDDDDDNNNNNNSGAIVAHNNNPPRRTMKVGQQVVDTLPADHPSSSTIQTHRTCSLCQRTLPRSQFSERDAFTINLSLSPSGITCRTCTMTVSAVKLKSMPETEQLLLDYASRGVQQGLLAIEQGRGNAGQVAGYLTSNNNNSSSSEMNNNNDSGALIVRQNTADGNGSITGKELTLFSNIGQSPNNNNNNNYMESYTNLMGLSSPSAARDVNTTFSGRSYAHTDSDRPANIANCKYIDALLQLPCYLNLNAFGIYKSSHDVSVSMSCLEAVRLYGTLDERYFVPHDVDGVPLSEEDDKNKKSKGGGDRGSSLQTNDAQIDDTPVNPKSVVCIVLGEGSTPRTAILASQHYGWTTIAIDPKLSEDWDGCHDDM